MATAKPTAPPMYPAGVKKDVNNTPVATTVPRWGVGDRGDE